MKEKILIVDDNIEFVDLARTWLQNAGYEEMEYEEEMEKIFVPVRRKEAMQDDELREEPDDVKVREIPRRWRVYQ